jgi:prepilin-type N-terminal cleavage/methylation domain-containing protein
MRRFKEIIMRKRVGFTLIELLVVIAIIAILAAILFPIFASAKGAAKKAKCASNYKQIMLAMIDYMNDYNQRLPYVTYWNRLSVKYQLGEGADDANQRLIVDTLGKYVKNQDIWLCPVLRSSDRIPDHGSAPYSSRYKWTDNGGRKGGMYENVASNTHWMYAVSPAAADPDDAPDSFRKENPFLTYTKTASDVRRPTKCVMIVELPYWNPSPHLAGEKSYGIHYGYFDGHVRFGITSSGNTMWDYNTQGWY